MRITKRDAHAHSKMRMCILCVFRVLEGGGVSGGDVQDFLINSLNT